MTIAADDAVSKRTTPYQLIIYDHFNQVRCIEMKAVIKMINCLLG